MIHAGIHRQIDIARIGDLTQINGRRPNVRVPRSIRVAHGTLAQHIRVSCGSCDGLCTVTCSKVCARIAELDAITRAVVHLHRGVVGKVPRSQIQNDRLSHVRDAHYGHVGRSLHDSHTVEVDSIHIRIVEDFNILSGRHEGCPIEIPISVQSQRAAAVSDLGVFQFECMIACSQADGGSFHHDLTARPLGVVRHLGDNSAVNIQDRGIVAGDAEAVFAISGDLDIAVVGECIIRNAEAYIGMDGLRHISADPVVVKPTELGHFAVGCLVSFFVQNQGQVINRTVQALLQLRLQLGIQRHGGHICNCSLGSAGDDGFSGRVIGHIQRDGIVVAALGRAVTRGEPRMEIVDVGHVVHPVEVNRDLVARQSEQRARDGDHHLGVLALVLYDTDLLPDTVLVGANGGRHIVQHLVVDDEVVALPAGILVLIGVDEEHHPVGIAVVRGNFFGATHVGVHHTAVGGQAGLHDVVAARGIDVFDLARGVGEVTPLGVIRVIRKYGHDLFPLLKITRSDVHGLGARVALGGQDTLELAHHVAELVEVVIGVAALHGLDVTGELGVELIHEAEIHCSKILCRPLVPAGD